MQLDFRGARHAVERREFTIQSNKCRKCTRRDLPFSEFQAATMSQFGSVRSVSGPRAG